MAKEVKVFIHHLSESMNDFLKRNNKGFNSKKDAKDAIKRYAALAFEHLDKFENPIEIEWTPVLTRPKNHKSKKRGYDVLNYAHQYKYSEDQLTALKKIIDDGNKFVKRHILNTPIFLEENTHRGIFVLIRELEESEIEEIEKKKINDFTEHLPKIKKTEEVDKDFAISFFKDEDEVDDEEIAKNYFEKQKTKNSKKDDVEFAIDFFRKGKKGK